jgi:anti-anti-sigma factor
MHYTLECRSDAVVIGVSGRVDESSWEQFGLGLSEAIATAKGSDVGRVIIDLTELDYMSSRGLRALTVAKREGEEHGIMISLASPNEVMREILAISRYDKLFTISDS